MKKEETKHPVRYICSTFVDKCKQLRYYAKVKFNPDVHPDSPLFLELSAKEKMNTKASKEKGKQEVEKLLQEWPEAIHIFTDGSSNPNPGPCGGGVIIYNYPSLGLTHTISMAGGFGSNNIAELQALGLAYCWILRLAPTLVRKVIIFSDSSYAIDIATGKSTPKKHTKLAKLIRSLFRRSTKQRPSTLTWVPGHVNILGNEEADRLAKLAASANDDDTPDIVKFPELLLDYS
jgi:ribonuclease HI